jgi:hypothetical protein
VRDGNASITVHEPVQINLMSPGLKDVNDLSTTQVDLESILSVPHTHMPMSHVSELARILQRGIAHTSIRGDGPIV